MIRQGGRWTGRDGRTVFGNGLLFHFRRLEELLWPTEKIWHRWNEIQLEEYLKPENRVIGIMGPSSSGKTNGTGTDILTDYYCFPECTTVLICSTTKERMQDRIFGEIKKYHRLARARFPKLPGHSIDGRMRIVTESADESKDGRDFRNGITGVPCFPSGTQVDTPSGRRPIESLKVGDLVLNALGFGRITQTHRRYSNRLVRIRISDGRKIDCTPEHPILTNRGWIKAIDLKTLDMVYSARETVQIMRESNASGISEPKILQRSMPRQIAGEAMQAMREVFSTLESKVVVGWQVIWAILQSLVRRDVGFPTQRMCADGNQTLQALRKADDKISLSSGVLLQGVPTENGKDALRMVREGVSFNTGVAIEIKDSFLRSLLQAEGEWEGVGEARLHPANTRGTFGLERVSSISLELPPKNWNCSFGWKTTLAQAGHCIHRLKALCGNRWRNSPDAKESCERHSTDKNTGGAWVESVKVLEPRSDLRFNKSEGGYSVHNIAVEGHPSYSVNGLIVHNCLIGGDFRGISEFIGIKNRRVRVAFDELQMLPPAVLLALSNLDKNPDFKVVGMGNPKETTDALGTLCEPIYELGGWDGNIDQTPETKVWKTHYGGICIQLVGTDSPNYDGKLGIPLISKEDIDRDIARYGKDSLKFTMMNQGMMPRGQGSRRVLTRQMAQKHGAMDPPQWLNSSRTKIAALDAAFGGVGGDRCVMTISEFGFESKMLDMKELDVNALTNQAPNRQTHKQIFAITETIIVPVKAGMKDDLPEDQIVSFVKEQCVTRGIPPQNFFFDAGMKSGLVSAFARLWSPQTNPIDCGATPSDRPVSAKITMPCRQYYSKFVTELWYSVRLTVEGGQFRGMTEAPLAEFCRREWTTVGNNKIEVESKQDMKEKFGKSPDLADSMAINLEGARRLGFVIEMPVSKEYRKENDQWKTELKKKAAKSWNEGKLTYQ